MSCAPSFQLVHSRLPFLTVIPLLSALLVFGGCNRRTIEITSEPTGALVKLNDVEVGRTPLQVDFKYYGRYDVQLAADGYRPLSTSAEAVAPWYEYPGPDLVTTATPTHVLLRWNFKLEPLPTDRATVERQVLERAAALRQTNARPSTADRPSQ